MLKVTRFVATSEMKTLCLDSSCLSCLPRTGQISFDYNAAGSPYFSILDAKVHVDFKYYRTDLKVLSDP